MDNVIQRLRASQAANENESYKLGLADGREWAKDTAETKDLKKLERIVDSYSWRHEWFSGQPTGSWGDHLLLAIDPEEFAEPNQEFWEKVAGARAADLSNDPDYLRGFAEGAVNLWREVKDKL